MFECVPLALNNLWHGFRQMNFLLRRLDDDVTCKSLGNKTIFKEENVRGKNSCLEEF